MRPRPPATGKRGPVERWTWLWRQLGFRTHMAVRNLFRNPGRTLTGITASALATATILTTLMLYDSAEHMVDSRFERVLHSDADVGMRDEASLAALREASALPGVERAEPMLAVVCTLQRGPVRRRVSVTGLSKDRRLTTPVDADGRPVDIPPTGLVMSRKLAEVLRAGAGERVLLTPVRGRRVTRRVPVSSVVEGYFGLACYADIHYLSGLVGESLAVNAVQMTTDPTRTDEFYRAVKRLPNAQGLSLRRQAKANIEQTFVRSMAATLGVTVLFAGVIALGATINASLTELADRGREVATFRVMGYRPRQVAGIFFRESVVVSGIGMLLAVPLSWVLVHVLAGAYDTELYRMPVIISPSTVLVALAVSAAFVLIAQLIVFRQVRKANWAEAIKIKE
jgi:putative ABC transport system permease protein